MFTCRILRYAVYASLMKGVVIMSKPMFPLSVERHFTFRAKIRSTGEVLESESFKTLYNVTLCHLRCEVGETKDTKYSQCDANIEFGYATSYKIKEGYYYEEWNTVNDIAFVSVTSLSVAVLRYSDRKTLWVTRNGRFE